MPKVKQPLKSKNLPKKANTTQLSSSKVTKTTKQVVKR